MAKHSLSTTERSFEFRMWFRSAGPLAGQEPPRTRHRFLRRLSITLAIATSVVVIQYGGILAFAAVASIVGAVVAVLQYVRE